MRTISNTLVIQGGMGVGVSTSNLARLCSRNPYVLGTVSLVGAEQLLLRNLQRGNQDFVRALEAFPCKAVAERIRDRYYVAGGIPAGQSFKTMPMFSLNPAPVLVELAVAGAFALVWLAKEGHSRPVSVNLLTKMELPTVFYLLGAMLAGVDCVSMGAGIPMDVPDVLDAIEAGTPLSYPISVVGNADGMTLTFNSTAFFGALPKMERPSFIPIVASTTLAWHLAKKKLQGRIQGLVFEAPTAGGHNAPPRGDAVDEFGQPKYGEDDVVDWLKIRKLGVRFWIGGSYASPEGLAQALALGAEGIQVGSAFAFCEDSGWDPEYRRLMRRLGFLGQLPIRTTKVSPTGFPFKVGLVDGTISDLRVLREPKCDGGGLRVLALHNGELVFRCPAEPLAQYQSKGGNVEDTVGRVCLCNALLAAVGLGNPGELPIFTMGDNLSFLQKLMRHPDDNYAAQDVIAYLLGSCFTRPG